MFIEKRQAGKDIKYYLVHSYRDGREVRKIRKYLGRNLSANEIVNAKKKAEKAIAEILAKTSVDIFSFSLSKNQIKILNRYDEKISIRHIGGWDWERFTEHFTYSTNAIEGSTILPDEIPFILKKKAAVDPEEIETRGAVEALNYIRKTKEDLSPGLIKKLHKICFEGSKHFAGEFRKVDVVIRDGRGNIVHRGTSAGKLGGALDDMIRWYRSNKTKFKPLVLAAVIHNQFEHIHPFQDGNGRVGRLLLNFILLRNGYPPINILPDDRGEYYNSLQAYSKNMDIKPTLKFLIKQYKKTLIQVTTK